MFDVTHSDFWELTEEVRVLLAAGRGPQAHGPLIQREAVACPHVRIRQPCCDALDGLAKSTVPVSVLKSPCSIPSFHVTGNPTVN